jgi:hypothetical protein
MKAQPGLATGLERQPIHTPRGAIASPRTPGPSQPHSIVFSHPAVLLGAFLVFWFGGAAVMSRIAGWHRLSALYPAPVRVHGQAFSFSTCALGPASFPIRYRRCVRVLVTEQGLGLCLMFPFRFHSPAVLVPWACITGCTEKQVMSTRKFIFSFAGSDRQLTLLGELGLRVQSARQAAIQPPG